MAPRTILVMGVCGSGKSTVGKAIASRLKCRFIEGDDYHPAANIAKMSAGISLTDEDRRPWLDALHQALLDAASKGETVVLACSALRRIYRDRLSEGLTGLQVLYLKGERETLLRNLTRRSGHFMQPRMLDSQLNTLEEPVHALVLSCDRPVNELTNTAIRSLHET